MEPLRGERPVEARANIPASSSNTEVQPEVDFARDCSHALFAVERVLPFRVVRYLPGPLVSRVRNSFHKDVENRRHAALQILAIATAIAVVCALPDDDFDIFISPTNFQLGTLALIRPRPEGRCRTTLKKSSRIVSANTGRFPPMTS